MFRSPLQLIWGLTIYLNPPPLEPSVLIDTRFFLQLMWDLTIHLPLGLSLLVSTPFIVHLLQGSASSFAHRSLSTSFRAQPPRLHTFQRPPPPGLSSLNGKSHILLHLAPTQLETTYLPRCKFSNRCGISQSILIHTIKVHR